MISLNSEVIKHPTALHYGNVSIGEGSSFWPYSVIRAEVNEVCIGKYCNIQDFVMIHVGDRTDTVIGDYCSISHRVVVHGATVEDNCLIGVGAILMDGVVVGRNSIVGAGAYVPPGTVIPPNSIVKGNPAEVVDERNSLVTNKLHAIYYNVNAKAYEGGNHRAWSDPEFKKFVKRCYKEIKQQVG